MLDRWVTGYQYDARGRLTFVGDTLYHYAAGTCTGPPIVDPDYGIKPCVGTGMTKTLQYVDTVGYDVVGNIVKNTGHGGTGTPTYDAANRLTSWPGLDSLTSDADGNFTSRKVPGGARTNYFWSPDGLLDSVKTSTGGFIRYDYNAFGLLVRKWITSAAPDRHFVWDQGHLAIELNGTLTQRVGEYAYLPGTDQPLALITGATAVSLVRVIYQDVQGSVVGLVNSNGTVNRYQTNSDPWGITNPWNIALPDTMRLRWQGLFFDGGISGLYYARARWYSPNIKRFLSPDPLGVEAGVNYYTFAGNDPMNSGDPFGLDRCTPEELRSGNKGTIPAPGGGFDCVSITRLDAVRVMAQRDWWPWRFGWLTPNGDPTIYAKTGLAQPTYRISEPCQQALAMALYGTISDVSVYTAPGMIVRGFGASGMLRRTMGEILYPGWPAWQTFKGYADHHFIEGAFGSVAFATGVSDNMVMEIAQTGQSNGIVANLPFWSTLLAYNSVGNECRQQP